jgi:hypothetical protein
MDAVSLGGFWTAAGFAEEEEGLVWSDKLCLPLAGAFTPSVTEARGRAVAPFGETAFAQAGAFAIGAGAVEGLADDKDRLVVGAGGATVPVALEASCWRWSQTTTTICC